MSLVMISASLKSLRRKTAPICAAFVSSPRIGERLARARRDTDWGAEDIVVTRESLRVRWVWAAGSRSRRAEQRTVRPHFGDEIVPRASDGTARPGRPGYALAPAAFSAGARARDHSMLVRHSRVVSGRRGRLEMTSSRPADRPFPP